MAAPVSTFIRTPDDAGNLGKKVWTYSRTIGPDSVHAHVVHVASVRSRLGVYFYHSGILTIPTTAHTPATTGFLWYINAAGSAVKCALRRFRTTIQFTVTTAVDVSVPRQVLALFTATGTPSGAQITAGKRDSTDATPVATMRTAMTGLTVTPGAVIRGELPPIVATASSATVQVSMVAQVGQQWDLEEDEMPVLRAGEGIVQYSADASTTANKRCISDWIVEEFE